MARLAALTALLNDSKALAVTPTFDPSDSMVSMSVAYLAWSLVVKLLWLSVAVPAKTPAPLSTSALVSWKLPAAASED